MKTIATLLAASFLVVFVLTTFVPYPPAVQAAHEAGFSQADIDTGLQYSFERGFFYWGYVAVELALLCALALTGWSRRWGDRLLAWTGNRRILAALAIGLAYVVLHEALTLPIGIASLYHRRWWGMSNLDLLDWLRDHYLALGINLIVEAIVVAGLYGLLTVIPRVWWLIAPLGASALAAAYAFIAPIWINPLFNDFTPLEQTQWKDQQSRVRAVIDKAGIPVGEILVMNASRQSNHTNAYFTGFGATRRIVLYDTLLKNHTPDQIESILAHEIGHWQHDHIVKGILLGTVAALFGFFVLHCVLRLAMGRAPWNLQSLADPAGLPLILLLMNLGAWVAMPLGNAVSRYFERQADQASLELANLPGPFIAAERKLATVNKSNVAPAPWHVWLFASHPPMVERIRMAQEWQDAKRRE